MLCWHALNSKVLESKHKVDGQTFLPRHGNVPHSGPKRLFHLGMRAFGWGERTTPTVAHHRIKEWLSSHGTSGSTQVGPPRAGCPGLHPHSPGSPHMHINYWATAGHKSPLSGLDQLWPSDPGSCLYPISNPLKLNPLHVQLPQEHTPVPCLLGSSASCPWHSQCTSVKAICGHHPWTAMPATPTLRKKYLNLPLLVGWD